MMVVKKTVILSQFQHFVTEAETNLYSKNRKN